MELTLYVDDLRHQLAVAAEAGGQDSRALAERLTAPLESAVRLVLLDALSAAAAEITRDLAPGSVDLRLRGREPGFVVTPPPTDHLFTEPDAPAVSIPRRVPTDGEEGAMTRINLRLAEDLKGRVEDGARPGSRSTPGSSGRPRPRWRPTIAAVARNGARLGAVSATPAGCVSPPGARRHRPSFIPEAFIPPAGTTPRTTIRRDSHAHLHHSRADLGGDQPAESSVAAFRCVGQLGRCRVKTSSADIQLDHTGRLEVNTGGGAIVVDRVAGHVEVSTGSGKVRVLQIDGTAVIKNSNGDIWVGEITGDVRLNAANGDISVDHAHAGITANTANGDVRIGDITRGSAALTTAFGEIEIGISSRHRRPTRCAHVVRQGAQPHGHRRWPRVLRRDGRSARQHQLRGHRDPPFIGPGKNSSHGAGVTATIPARPAISATGLRKAYGDNVVLDGIDLTVAEGTIFSLLGPNGAGKTTMVQILSTLITADRSVLTSPDTNWPPIFPRCAPRLVSPASSRPLLTSPPVSRT